MNKQDKVNAVLEVLKSNSTSKRGVRTREHVRYTKMIPEELEGIRLAPQALRIVEIILTSPEDSWSEPELQKLIQDNSVGLSKKQEPWKIFQYYRKALIDAGFIVMEK